MYLRKRVGTPSDPADPVGHREAGGRIVRLRRLRLRLPDAADRPQRALGGVAPDTADPDRRALPRERAGASSAVSPRAVADPRSSSRASRSQAVTPRRGGRSIAAVSDLVLENYANANLIWRDGAGRRLTPTARALPTVGREAPRGRDPAFADRDHDRVPDGRRHGRPRRADSRVRDGSTSPSGRRSPRSRSRASSSLRICGRGAGRSGMSGRTTRTRRTPRASGSGRATPSLCDAPGSSGASSMRTSRPASSTCPRAHVASTDRHV